MKRLSLVALVVPVLLAAASLPAAAQFTQPGHRFLEDGSFECVSDGLNLGDALTGTCEADGTYTIDVDVDGATSGTGITVDPTVDRILVSDNGVEKYITANQLGVTVQTGNTGTAYCNTIDFSSLFSFANADDGAGNHECDVTPGPDIVTTSSQRHCWTVYANLQPQTNDGYGTGGLPQNATSTSAVKSAFPIDVEFRAMSCSAWQDNTDAEGDRLYTLRKGTSCAGVDGGVVDCTWASSDITCTIDDGGPSGGHTEPGNHYCDDTGSMTLTAGDFWQVYMNADAVHDGWTTCTFLVCANEAIP